MWYGKCRTRGTPCLYNGPAKPFTDPKGLKVLNSLCPELRNQHTCCSTRQLDTLAKNLEILAQLTTRCPACWNNMRRLLCLMTCTRDQSLYMDPKEVDNSTGHAAITDINYYISPTFKQGLFDSCKDVNFPGNNGKVLTMICGTTAEKCTPQKLLRSMGNSASGFMPFDIYYPLSVPTNSTISPMNITVFKCNKQFIDPQINRTASPCSCQDCVASCPVRPTLPPQSSPLKIMGLDLLSFGLLVAYIGLLVIFIPVSLICIMRKKQKRYSLVSDDAQANLKYTGGSYPPVTSSSLPVMVDSSPGLCVRMGNKMESVLRRQFTKWGVYCSTHPFLVMGGSLLVVATLACGLVRFTVTTDLVELWSAPNSESRKQKDIFDSRFGPFYRTEQLIIRSTNPTPAGYTRYGDSKFIPFGPIFHLDLLNQVFPSIRLYQIASLV